MNPQNNKQQTTTKCPMADVPEMYISYLYLYVQKSILFNVSQHKKVRLQGAGMKLLAKEQHCLLYLRTHKSIISLHHQKAVQQSAEILINKKAPLKVAIRKSKYIWIRSLTFFRRNVDLFFRVPIRIRIGSGFNPVCTSGSGSGSRRAKMTNKSRNFLNFYVLKCWMFSLES